MKKQLINFISKICYLLPIVVIFVVSKYNLLYYIQSDDYQMNYISMGGISGSPDEHLVFIKSIFGYITRFLYNINSNINWFGLIYIILIVVFTYILLLVLSLHFDNRVALVLSLVFEIISICWLTFTTIAYFSVAVGLIAVIEGVIRNNEKIKKYILLISGVLLITCGFALRSTAMVTGTLLALPVLIISANKLIRVKTFYFALIGIVLLIGAVQIIDNGSYESKMWRDYKAFNNARAQVVDYPIEEYKDNEVAYKKLSMSKNDVNCMKRWIFADKQIFSTNKLEQVVKSTKATTRYNLKISQILKDLLTIKETYIALIIAILLMLLCSSKKARIMIVLQILFVYGLVTSLIILNRSLPRVYIPVFIIGVLYLFFIYLFDRKNEDIALNKKKKIIMGISLLLIAISTVVYVNMYRGKVSDRKIAETNFKDLRQYIINHQDVAFASNDIYNVMNYQSVMNIKAQKPYINLMNTGHWNTYDEAYYKQVNKYNLSYKDRLLIDIAKDKNVFFIDCGINKTPRMINTEIFIKEHTNKNIKVIPIKTFKKEYYRLYSIEFAQ